MRVPHFGSESSGNSLIAGCPHAEGSHTMRIRVAVAGDHSASQAELRNVLGAQPDIEIGAAPPDAPPDVTVLDAAALSAGLVETIERIRRQPPPARVLVLTTHDTPGCLEAALAAGATGYVLTPAADQELLAAIRAVHRGRTFIDADQAGELATGRALPASAPAHARPRHPLSPREREVLVL